MAGYQINRLKASSLLEVIISMLVIMIVFSTAMLIYTNVLRTSVSFTTYKAETVLLQLLAKAEKYPVLSQEIFQYGDYQINKQVETYQHNPKLLEIHFQAFNAEKEKLADIKKVVYVR